MDAAERWRVLRLHVEDQIPLAVLARDAGVSARTLQRWNQLYRVGGVVALDPHARTDKGVRRTSAETIAFVERLALTRPRPSTATLHRLAATDAQARSLPAPSYATVQQIVQALDPALVTWRSRDRSRTGTSTSTCSAAALNSPTRRGSQTTLNSTSSSSALTGNPTGPG